MMMDTSSCLFRRQDGSARGRHLVATQRIEKGQLIFVERPLLALQSLDNQRYVTVCKHCKAFCGGPDYALLKRFGKKNDSNQDVVVPCRDACGHVYCSSECEADAWQGFHKYLCTGRCIDVHDPLVKFNEFVVETNEILLLVAEWWVAQHLHINNPEYTDFLMEAWWDVATADLQKEPGGFAEAFQLHETLQQICQDAAKLLNQALSSAVFPPITDLDIAKRIGACEQNAIGIRKRHPLCRDVFDRNLRERRHAEIIQCLEEAGFIGNDNEEDEEGQEDYQDGELSGASTEDSDNKEMNSDENEEGEEEEWDYSVDEIAAFLAELFMDEDGTVRDNATNSNEPSQERDTTGDDLDYIFPPLDGTAMYALACKMNHSCDPNVIVLYKASGWGPKYPLAAYCVALKDILEGDELCISYIDADVPYEQRQNALTNYGFKCECQRCQREKAGMTEERLENNDLFGGDEEDLFGVDEDGNDDSNAAANDEFSEDVAASEDAESALQKRLERLDTVTNHSRFGCIPVKCLASVSSFVLRTVKSTSISIAEDYLSELLQKSAAALGDRDFCMCRIVGADLEESLYNMLRKKSAWPNIQYREAYWCSSLTAAIGLVHRSRFLEAMGALDKSLILGLSRDDDGIGTFFSYVERHASQMTIGPYPPSINGIIPSYRDSRFKDILLAEALSRPIQYPIEEMNDVPSPDIFRSTFVSTSKPLVLPGFAHDWPAISQWCQISYFARNYGHRLVPVELGSMMANNMKEELMSLRGFLGSYLVPSTSKDYWSLQDAVIPASRIAYLAQHPLLNQIPALRDDLDMHPGLCGPDGPSHVYLWMGTGGTRTPLHFDSYDNLFIQLVGAKYIRLYSPEESGKLYVSTKSSYGLQGNMSEIDCEQEDWEKHPAAKDASFTEVMLLPGDCLFVPARTWHYVRSLSTSVSVNYWF